MIYNKGCGSALIEHKRRLWDLATSMNAASSVPITLKMRIGKDEKDPVVHKYIHEAENCGLQAITVSNILYPFFKKNKNFSCMEGQENNDIPEKQIGIILHNVQS